MDIRISLDRQTVKKILCNKDNYIKYLNILKNHIDIEGLKYNSKKEIINSPEELQDIIIEYWTYAQCKDIIRNLFITTTKYQNGLTAEGDIAILQSEWHQKQLGQIAWPCKQGQFETLVQYINNLNDDRDIKDEKTKDAALRYRRIKEINTARNDFIEVEIFLSNTNVIPTLNHRRGVDFFINGKNYDQKVAKSPTKQFIDDKGKDWRNEAINHPEDVAKYLYEFQSEERFGAEPRLLIVYLEEEISTTRIKEIIAATNLTQPIQIQFDFAHKGGTRHYHTECFVIVLYN